MKKKGNEALKKEYEAMGKKEKGLANIVADTEKGGCQVDRARATHASGKWTTGRQRMPQYLGLLGVYGYF